MYDQHTCTFVWYREPRKHKDLRQCLKRSCGALRINHRIDSCCHVLNVFLTKEFEGKLSCTIEDIIQKASASDKYPIPIQASRLCELAEALSTRTKILFLRNKESPEKSWIVLDIDTLLSKINGRIFAPQGLPEHCLTPTHTGVLPWSQIERHLPDLDPSLVVTFLGRLEFCQVVKDPEVLSLIKFGKSDTLSLDSYDLETDSPTSVHRRSICSQMSYSSSHTNSSGVSSISNHTSASGMLNEKDGLESNWLSNLYSTNNSPQHPASINSNARGSSPTTGVNPGPNQPAVPELHDQQTPPAHHDLSSTPPATEAPQSRVNPPDLQSSSLPLTGVSHIVARPVSYTQPHHQAHNGAPSPPNHSPFSNTTVHPSSFNHERFSQQPQSASSPTIVTPPSVSAEQPPSHPPHCFSPPAAERLLSPLDAHTANHQLHHPNGGSYSFPKQHSPLSERTRQASSPPRYSSQLTTSKIHDQLHNLGIAAGGSQPSLPEEQTWPPSSQLRLHRSPSDSCMLSSSQQHRPRPAHPQALSQGGSPRISRHQLYTQGPANDDKFLFFPGLVNSGQPSGEMWLRDESFVFYSGWCLQSAQPHQFFTPRFLQTLILRLAFGFAVSRPPNGGITNSMSLFSRECTIWKNGLRWLNLDGIETFVEMVEDGKALVLLMRAKVGSELKGVSLRSALIRKILDTKEECCQSMRTDEYFIDPKHLKERESYPIITKRLDQLTRYDVRLIARAIVAENGRIPSELMLDVHCIQSQT